MPGDDSDGSVLRPWKKKQQMSLLGMKCVSLFCFMLQMFHYLHKGFGTWWVIAKKKKKTLHTNLDNTFFNGEERSWKSFHNPVRFQGSMETGDLRRRGQAFDGASPQKAIKAQRHLSNPLPYVEKLLPLPCSAWRVTFTTGALSQPSLASVAASWGRSPLDVPQI